ncbi:hypothetical protein ACN27B_18805 [Micromonospora sp. WMMD754]|uniref:hypothetical protein n=1 Tax=Micromonospora sp. WMMD754 TaxID=3404114 RepID=UPI003BF55A96
MPEHALAQLSGRPAGNGSPRRFTQGAADGFNVIPPLLPHGLEAFVDHVVPLLRRRGLFRSEYTGRALREHYGLPRPASVHVTRELVAS